MFWFPIPLETNPDVIKFLEYEKQWLTSNWVISKILFALTVPITLSILAISLWKRNLWLGIGVEILMAFGKIIWNITSAGESGEAVLILALVGLIFTSIFLFIFINKKKNI